MPQDLKGVLGEFKRGELHSGSKTGPVVHDMKQALAIGYSEERALKRKGQKKALRKMGEKK